MATKFKGWDGLEAQVKNGRLKLNKKTKNKTIDRMDGLQAENKNGRLYLYANPDDINARIPGSVEIADRKGAPKKRKTQNKTRDRIINALKD